MAFSMKVLFALALCLGIGNVVAQVDLVQQQPTLEDQTQSSVDGQQSSFSAQTQSTSVQFPPAVQQQNAVVANLDNNTVILQRIRQTLQSLRSEVQFLTGQIDNLTFELEQLKVQRQQDYIDLDNRLNSLSRVAVKSEVVPASTFIEDAAASASVGTGDSFKKSYQDAFILLKNRQTDKALSLFERATQDPDDSFEKSMSLYWLGRLYRAKQENEKARRHFVRLVTLYPQHRRLAEVQLLLAFIYFELSDHTSAMDYFQEIIYSENESYRQQALTFLQSIEDEDVKVEYDFLLQALILETSAVEEEVIETTLQIAPGESNSGSVEQQDAPSEVEPINTIRDDKLLFQKYNRDEFGIDYGAITAISNDGLQRYELIDNEQKSSIDSIVEQEVTSVSVEYLVLQLQQIFQRVGFFNKPSKLDYFKMPVKFSDEYILQAEMASIIFPLFEGWDYGAIVVSAEKKT